MTYHLKKYRKYIQQDHIYTPHFQSNKYQHFINEVSFVITDRGEGFLAHRHVTHLQETERQRPKFFLLQVNQVRYTLFNARIAQRVFFRTRGDYR